VDIVKSSVSTAGGSTTSGDLTVIWAMGEVAAREKKQSNMLLSEGFVSPDFYKYLGVEDYEPITGITLFPNPSSDIINLTLPYAGNFEIHIFDISQREMYVKNPEGKQEMQLHIEDFVSGTYILCITDRKNKRFSALKFIKQ